MTAFDITTLVILGISALLAFARGLIREVFSIAALVAGGAAALYGYPIARPLVGGWIETEWLASVATGAGLFLGVYILVTIFTIQLHNLVHQSQTVGLLDRSAGGLFGLARGLVIVALGVMVLRAATPPDKLPEWLTKAAFYPLTSMTADGLASLAPQGSPIAAQGDPTAPETDETAAQGPQTDEGYSNRDRERLDQLMNAASGSR
jgi:membrane protein required for colicin V production